MGRWDTLSVLNVTMSLSQNPVYRVRNFRPSCITDSMVVSYFSSVAALFLLFVEMIVDNLCFCGTDYLSQRIQFCLPNPFDRFKAI